MKPLKRALQCVLACITWLTAASVQGQGFPDKPIRIISPFAAGSSTDVIARIIAQKITGNTGQPVIVDARPGANGILGADAAAKATPDGYTMLLASNGTHGVNVSLFNKLPYDPVKDFEPVILVGRLTYFMLVGINSPYYSVADLIAAAKANPGKLTIAHAASVAQLTGELLKSTANVSLVSVPYKSGANEMTDLAGGQVDIAFDGIPSSLPLVKSGRLRALAVTSARRSALAPDIPTIAESGYPSFEAGAWVAFFAPAGTPKDRVAKLHAEVNRVLQDNDVKERLKQVGMEAGGGTPEQLGDSVTREIAKWAKVFKDANLPRQ